MILFVIFIILLILLAIVLFFCTKKCQCNTNNLQFIRGQKHIIYTRSKNVYGGGNIITYSGAIPEQLEAKMIGIGWGKNDNEIAHFSFDNNAILCGQMIQVGNEFSNKNKLEKHFSHKDYFPKWEIGDLCILKNKGTNKDSHASSFIITDNCNGGNDGVSKTKYISNPLLYKEKKFNLQVYFALYKRNETFSNAVVCPHLSMQVASENYQNGQYENKNIHITNTLFTDLRYTSYPSDLQKADQKMHFTDLQGQIQAIEFDHADQKTHSSCSESELEERKLFMSKLQILPTIRQIISDCQDVLLNLNLNCSNSFELLTLDIIVDNNHKVWLMDMHRTLENMHRTLEKSKVLSSEYWDWVLYNVILSNFGLYTFTLNSFARPSMAKSSVIILQPLHLATPSNLSDLVKIGTTPEVYKYISYGKIWNEGYVKGLYKEAVSDNAQLKRDYYHWLILLFVGHGNQLLSNSHGNQLNSGFKCVGYIGIRPYEDVNVSFPNVVKCVTPTYFKVPENAMAHKRMKPPIIAKGEINCYQMRYFTSVDHRGQNLASIGGMHCVHFFKSIYPTKPLFANILENNIASQKTAQKMGFHIVEKNKDYTLLEV